MTTVFSRRVTVRMGNARFGLAIGHLLVIGLVIAVGVSTWITFATSVFGVRKVVVEGTTVLTKAQVREVAGVHSGAPLARLNTAAVSQRVSDIREVAHAEVFRAWPHTLRIVVTERVAVAVVAHGEQFELVDASGVAFRTVDEPPPLPLIEVERLKAGERITTAVVEVAQALTPELIGLLDKITAPTAAQVTVNLLDGRVIFWGDSSRNSRKARVATALLERPGDYIDVSAPGVVTVR